MSEKLAYEIYYIELWHIFTIIFVISINFYIYLKARKNALLYTYMVVEGLLLIWLLSKIFKTVSPTEDVRWFFIVTQYLGNCFLGPAFFTFAFTYAKGKLPSTKLIFYLCIPSLFFYISMMTNSLHMMFYSYYDFYRDSFGPLFYMNQGYTYALMLMGIFLCGHHYFLELRAQRIQALIILVSVAIPLVINILYVAKLFKPLFGFRPLFDITPITCNLSLILFAIATFRYRFFDLSNIAWRKVYNQIPEGIFLMNHHMVVVAQNQSCLMTSESNEILKAVLNQKDQDIAFKKDYISATGKHFELSLTALTNKRKNNGYILSFTDKTFQENALQNISNKNEALKNANAILSKRVDTKQSLAIYKTRNFIGRELHDILGHSIVLTLSILEVAKLSLEKDPKMAKEKLIQAITILKDAKNQTDYALLYAFNESISPMNPLITALETVVMNTRKIGQNIDFIIQGNATSTLSKAIDDAVIRLCQEAITNAIKHGKAEKIDIILRFHNAQLEIHIIDNGIGCSEIIHGYGLSGMKARIVTMLNGSLDYGSLDKGFIIKATIPN